MDYSLEKRLLGVLIADHLANLSERSNIIENSIYLDDSEGEVSGKRRKKAAVGDKSSTSGLDEGSDDLAAAMLGIATQTEHCLILYYKLLDMSGTINACIDLLDKSAKSSIHQFDRRVEVAISSSRDPEAALQAVLLVSSSLIRDITANGLYKMPETPVLSKVNGSKSSTFVNSNISISTGNNTSVFKGIGFVEAIHEARESAMKDNSSGFDTLKTIIDRVGGRVSHANVFIYRKILVKLLGLLHTSLPPSVKELLFEAVGFLTVYINDVRDIDDADIDTIDMISRLAPAITPKLLAILPKVVESNILNCSISTRLDYAKYLHKVANRVFNLLDENLDNDCVCDIYIALHNWLELIHKFKEEGAKFDNVNLLNKLVFYYCNLEKSNFPKNNFEKSNFDKRNYGCAIEYHMHEILNCLGKIDSEIILQVLDIDAIKSRMSKVDIYSLLKLLNLLWNSSGYVNSVSILDILNDVLDLSQGNLQTVVGEISKFESKILINLPESHKVYSKISQLVKLPESVENVPNQLVINIYLARKALLPLLKSISAVHSYDELHYINQIDEFMWDSNDKLSSHYELCLFLFTVIRQEATSGKTTRGKSTRGNVIREEIFERCVKNFKNNVYCYFAMQSISNLLLTINDINQSLELACLLNKILRKFQAQLAGPAASSLSLNSSSLNASSLESFSSSKDSMINVGEIATNIDLLLVKSIMEVKEGRVAIDCRLWDDLRELGCLSVWQLLGALASIDEKWDKISHVAIGEITKKKLNEFAKSPKSHNIAEYLTLAYRLLLIDLGSDATNHNIIKTVSNIFDLGDFSPENGGVFANGDAIAGVFTDLFVIFNKCCMKGDLALQGLLTGVWENFVAYVVKSLDERGIAAIANSIEFLTYKVSFDKVSFDKISLDKDGFDIANMLNKLFLGYDSLLEERVALQVHATALIDLAGRIIDKYCIDGRFYASELKVSISKVIYKGILLVREYPNTCMDLSKAILNLFKILKTQRTIDQTDYSTFQLDIEIKFKCDLLAEKVGVLRNTETNETSTITLEYALMIFTFQNYYINRKHVVPDKFDRKLIELIRPCYQLIRLFVRELCVFANTPNEQKKELSDFIDKYVIPMFFNDGIVSKDFCNSLHEFLRIRKPKLVKSQPNLKLASIINGAKIQSKYNSC